MYNFVVPFCNPICANYSQCDHSLFIDNRQAFIVCGAITDVADAAAVAAAASNTRIPRCCRRYFIICRRHYFAVVRYHFFGNNSDKPEPIRTKFYIEMSVRVARSLCQTGAKWRRKKQHFANFLSPKNASFHLLPVGQFPWNLNTTRIGVVMNSFGTELRIFPISGHLPPKSHFSCFFSGQFRCARSSLGL